MNRARKSFLPFLALASTSLAFSACAHKPHMAASAIAPPEASLVRTSIEDTVFTPFIPGTELHYIYGGIDQNVPTAQVARLDAGVSFPKHIHAHDYYAVVISGNYQHWEDGEPDQGPVMTGGSTFFQGGGAPHYDACLGPETCVVYVYFPVSADATFLPED
jgi:quercetin dioxygenase-like cupin family protein